jgi:poly-gamma-glutamate synthesis protein (capsule biosynthesis protein)
MALGWGTLALVAGCSSGPSDTSAGPPPVASSAGATSTFSATTPTAPSTVTSTAPKASTTSSAQPVTIAFAGDINFEGAMATRLARDPASAIGPFAPILSAADLAIGNLESAIATGGTPENKDFTFRAPPSSIDALRAGGLDTVSMANNHGRDYGPVGLSESLAVKDAQRDHFIIGIGHDDADAYAAFTATVKGQRVAVIAATQVIDGELVASWTAGPGHPGLASAKDARALVAAVQRARANADIVVVFLHWGVERNTCPSDVQRTLAGQLADAGADIVVGGHAHRLQGAGMLGTTFVGYGLGNFDFAAVGADAEKTGVVQVTMTGRHVDGYQFVPGVIRGSVAQPLAGAAAAAAVGNWNALRPCTGLAP